MDSSWVRIKGWAGIEDTVVGVYYRSPDQEEEVDEAFYKQLVVASSLMITITGTGSLGGLSIFQTSLG